MKSECFRQYLKSEYSYKKVCCKNPNFFSEDEMERKYYYATNYIKYHFENYNFVFIDEQSWNLDE